MAEGSNNGPRRHNRANWVALRTLRQLPKVVGETRAGEPIVEVHSVRLVLRDGAAHFSRVTTCSTCGREVPGGPVLGPADLDHPPYPVICKDCVRTASVPVLTAGRRPVEAAAEPAASPEGAPPAHDTPVAALERRVIELAELVNGHRADLEAAIAGRLEETRVEVRTLATKELARAQEDIDRMMKGVVERVGRTPGDAGAAQAVEARLTRSIERLTEQLDEQRTELVADLEARLAQLLASIEDRSGAPLEPLRTQLVRPAVPEREDSGALEARLSEVQVGSKAEAARIEAALNERLDRLAAHVGPDRERLAGLEAQLRDLQRGLQAETTRLAERIEGLAQQVSPDGRRVEALEARLGELQAGFQAEALQLAARLDRAAQEAAPERERFAGLEAALRALQTTVEEQLVTRAEAAAADATRLDALDEQLRQLDERVRGSGADAARVEQQLSQRLDRQAERMTRAAADSPRLDELEQRLDEAVGRLAALVESQRLEFRDEVRDGLAEVRAAVAAVENGNAGRLQKLETALAERAAQLSELADLQATLDTGLGELRSAIEELRDTTTRAAGVDSRLESLVVPQLLPVEPGRGRRGAKKSADAVAGLSAAVQGLLADHRQLRAEVRTLENESETAVRASARASAQATAVGPLRQDVRALRDEVVAQNEAVAALAKTVESLRKAVQPKLAAKAAATSGPAAPPAAATKTTKATTATKATKATKAVKATKATKAAKATKATKKA